MKALVLAGAYPQIALIQELKARGMQVLLADYTAAPVAKPYADRFFQVSTLDVEAISALAVQEKVDFVITACTDQALLTVAEVSQRLGLPCYLDPVKALQLTNKAHMKALFAAYGVPSAKHVILCEENMGALPRLQYPLIVKPVDCNSSKGVKKVFGEEACKAALAEAYALSKSKKAVVEEFIDGVEITVDAYVRDGKAYVISKAYSDKIPSEEAFVIYRTRFPIAESEDIHRQIDAAAQRITDAFGLRDSLLLIQLICDGKKIAVLECSARTGGGIKHELIKKVSGFDVIAAAVDLTLGNPPQPVYRASETKYIVNTFLYCKEGIFERLDGFAQLKEAGIISGYALFKAKGTQMRRATSSGDRIASFTVQADTTTALEEKYDLAKARIQVLDPSGKDILCHAYLAPLSCAYGCKEGKDEG